MQFKSLADVASSFTESELIPQEIAPGVRMHRRTIFKLSLLATFIASLDPTSSLSRTYADDAPEERLALEELIAKIRPEAKALISAQHPDEAHYVARMAKLLSQSAELERYRSFPGGEGWSMEPAAFVPPILLYQIQMEPNAKIEIHDHRHHNGIILVQKGDARLRCFEPAPQQSESPHSSPSGDSSQSEDSSPSGDPSQIEDSRAWDPLAETWPDPDVEFTLKKTRDEIIRAGATATLTRITDNIHELQAGPQGCDLLDLFTNFKPNALSMRIKWDGKFLDEQQTLCRVQYIAPDHTH